MPSCVQTLLHFFVKIKLNLVDPYSWGLVRCHLSIIVHGFLSFLILMDGNPAIHTDPEDAGNSWSWVHSASLWCSQPNSVTSSHMWFKVPTFSQNLQISFSGPVEPSPTWYRKLPSSDKFSVIVLVVMQSLLVIVGWGPSLPEKFPPNL